MKKVIRVIIVSLVLIALISACKKNETKKEEPSVKQSTSSASTAQPQATGEVNADVNCSKTYDFMKAFVEQMEAQMAKQGKQLPKKQDFPTKEKFVKACKELPKEIIVCLDMEYSMSHQQECQEAKKNADPEKMKKFEEMLK